jgi:glycerophosphoryl diester phosphodiesterase
VKSRSKPAAPKKAPLVWGHRGTRGTGKPSENTLTAMRLALTQGAGGIELDVRLCKSGEVVVLHDVDLQRLAGVALRAQDATLAELQAHDLGRGERVPTLLDAMSLVLGSAHEARLNIELKPDVPSRRALVEAVAQCIEAQPARTRMRILISSFSPAICAAMRARLPEIGVAFLYERFADAPNRPEGIAIVHPHHALLDNAYVASLHAQGIAVNTWTVNDPARAKVLAAAGVDGIITDDVPAILDAVGEG